MGVNTGTNRSRGGLQVNDNNGASTVFAYGVNEIVVTAGTLTNIGQGKGYYRHRWRGWRRFRNRYFDYQCNRFRNRNRYHYFRNLAHTIGQHHYCGFRNHGYYQQRWCFTVPQELPISGLLHRHKRSRRRQFYFRWNNSRNKRSIGRNF